MVNFTKRNWGLSLLKRVNTQFSSLSVRRLNKEVTNVN
jgi:hypothetical protein